MKRNGNSEYHKSRKTLQGKHNIEGFSLQVDQQTKENMETIHEYADKLLNMKISKNVMVRRAVALYLIHFMAAFYKAETGSAEDRISTLARFFEAEREHLLAAAEGFMLREV